MVLQIKDLPLKGKRALLRVDFNVPLNKDGTISDDTRIRATIPTIQEVIKLGGKVILMSHLGRPKGVTPSCTLKPCAQRLGELLKKPVQFVSDCIGPQVEKAIAQMKEGDILLLENLRFYDAEEHPEKDPEFAKKLASLGDVYINDAFGTAHRAHASTAVIAQYFPGKAAAGLLLLKEIHALGSSLLNPKRPFVAVIGGAKISTKIGVLRSLLEKADSLLIGGAMAYTFMKAKQIPTGDSPVENDMLEEALLIMDDAQKSGKTLLLPVDIVVASEFRDGSPSKIVSARDGIPDGYQGMDIGAKTIEQWTPVLAQAKTIFWNGPVGVFEFPSFATGTRALAQAIASCKSAFSIVGGGDSIAALEQAGLQSSVSHVSTGGGASLEFIEQGTLPGIEALEKAQRS
jgi:phosphoglycerate kinase